MSMLERYSVFDDQFDSMPEDNDIRYESDHAPFEIEQHSLQTAADMIQQLPEVIIPPFDLETQIKERIVT